MGPVEERGTVMKRISTAAGVAAAELDAASTGRFDVLCIEMLVPMAPIDKVARYKSRGGTTHHVCRPRGSSPTSPARSVSPHT